MSIIDRDRQAALTPYAGILLLFVIGWAYTLTGPTSQALTLVTSVVVYGLAASGLGFLWGQVGEVNIAHGAIFGVGAYTAGVSAQHDISFLVSLVICVVTGAVAGLLVALPSLRTRGHYFVILTFAIGEVSVQIATRLKSITGGHDGLTIFGGIKRVLGLQLNQRDDYFLLTLGITCVVLVLLLALTRSRWGATLRGIRENEDLARALGTSVVRNRIIAFSISGVVGAIGGQLYAFQTGYIEPSLFNTHLSIIFMLVVLIGGRKYLMGPLIGGAVYVLLPEVIPLSPQRAQILFGILLILAVLVLPGGVASLGTKVRQRLSRREGRDASVPPAPEPVPPREEQRIGR